MSPSSLSLKAGAAALMLAYMLPTSVATTTTGPSYYLNNLYQGNSFFDGFYFQTEDDPTHGYVDYQSQSQAYSKGLAKSTCSQAFFGVDNSSVLTGSNARGRASVRLESKKQYDTGLFIADIAHMPGSICGTWPAFWTVDLHNWPEGGEIDIIENINEQTFNQETLHTLPGCSLTQGYGGANQDLQSTNCDTSVNYNSGCAVLDSNSQKQPSYGTSFNSGGGGVYAMEWTTTTIKIWNFARGQVPSNIPTGLTGGNPDPSTWGTPQLYASTAANCNVGSLFKNHSIVFDTTFCGDYAGNSAFYDKTTCYTKRPDLTCSEYVAAFPRDYNEAYWLVNYVAVYETSKPVTAISASVCSSTTTSKSSTTSITTSSASTKTSSSSTIKTSSTSTVKTTSSSIKASSTSTNKATSTSTKTSSTSTTKATSTSTKATSTSTTKTTSSSTKATPATSTLKKTNRLIRGVFAELVALESTVPNVPEGTLTVVVPLPSSSAPEVSSAPYAISNSTVLMAGTATGIGMSSSAGASISPTGAKTTVGSKTGAPQLTATPFMGAANRAGISLAALVGGCVLSLIL